MALEIIVSKDAAPGTLYIVPQPGEPVAVVVEMPDGEFKCFQLRPPPRPGIIANITEEG